MSEQIHIFSPPLSPLSVDLIDEDIDEINSEHERISLKFNEMLAYINDDTNSTSINSIDFKDFESEVEEQEIFDKDAVKGVDSILSKLGVSLQSCPPLCRQAFENIKNPKCICCLYYKNLGGHIHHRSGIRGKCAVTCITEKLHKDDITKGLEFMGNLLIKIAQTGNNEIKKIF
ncbi:hypothetical protein C1646_769846 [Rhizophagus diaphanus]|nr:hypothetical protein C1646_769846 [Rhizophagus diaphanus] [Rhizophagus sp. MUCL 43196]